ncbi:hypothetical protein DFH29DRAFT_1000785 [Suillus ampliporus]|nr:hypothetical protein DFH29DRAFT_1000785 [Suillus ampliporus]
MLLSSSLPQASPDLFDDLHSFAGSTPSGFSRGTYMHQPTPNFITVKLMRMVLAEAGE